MKMDVDNKNKIDAYFGDQRTLKARYEGQLAPSFQSAFPLFTVVARRAAKSGLKRKL